MDKSFSPRIKRASRLISHASWGFLGLVFLCSFVFCVFYSQICFLLKFLLLNVVCFGLVWVAWFLSGLCFNNVLKERRGRIVVVFIHSFFTTTNKRLLNIHPQTSSHVSIHSGHFEYFHSHF